MLDLENSDETTLNEAMPILLSCWLPEDEILLYPEIKPVHILSLRKHLFYYVAKKPARQIECNQKNTTNAHNRYYSVYHAVKTGQLKTIL